MVTTVANNIFEKLHHSVNVFNSLQNCRDTFVMNREGIDERLFEELSSFEEFMKRFESTFLEIIMEDMRDISNAAVINPDNSEKAKELVDGMEELIGSFSRMESESIQRSQALISAANNFKMQLANVKKELEKKVRPQEKHKKALDFAMRGFPHANGG